MGETFTVRAEIDRIHAFSAHADRDELLKWLDAFVEKPERVHLVHGEEKVMKKFAHSLRERGLKPHIQITGEAAEL